MAQKFKDNGRALLSGSINALATSLTVEAGKADRFPVGTTSNWASPADWFKVVVIDSSGNREVIKVGTRTLGSGVLGNLQRGQDGTTALSFNAGSAVIQPITAADIENVLAGIYAGGISVGDVITQEGVQGRVTPVGGIIMWSGSIANIQTGWQLCDGTNGTPDLRDKFIIGASADNASAAKTNITGALTKSGGNKDAIVAAHTHTVTVSGTTGSENATHSHNASDSGHAHGGGRDGGASGAGPGWGSSFIAVLSNYVNTALGFANITLSGQTANHQHAFSGTGSTANAGVAATDANLPPYYALAYIQCMA